MIRGIAKAHPRIAVFVIGFACAIVFAAYTHHAWEDYYITYRSSKNLATGHGLVFNVGDRLHTFTSPLGVLLPALASLLTLNRSDEAALWIFRVMSCTAFAGAAVLLFGIGRRWAAGLFLPAIMGVAWLCTDAKSVDFTINGMETGFMLLFLAYLAWGLFAAEPGRRPLHLGLAWAGLMWTRPDSFIYIGLLSGGAWIFNDAARSGLKRGEWLKVFVKAGLICTAIYLPWFAGAWWYYGSPVPHTIIAKASVAPAPWTLSSLAGTLARMPRLAWTGASTLEGALLPAYYTAGPWPAALILWTRGVAIATAVLWLVPKVRAEVRAASLAFLGAHVYLTYFPYFPFPWYLPPTALLAFLAWMGLTAQAWSSARAETRIAARIALGLLLAFALVEFLVQAGTMAGAARQMAALQRVIDNGNRRKIGEWLHQYAAPGDRVFLEPLGYIGFFSGLKTYDWPGLSSREVVAAHARVGPQWAMIIDHLGADWLVLRPSEEAQIQRDMPQLLTLTYERANVFDVRASVEKLRVPGRHLLEMDAYFTVYRRRSIKRHPTEFGEMESRYPGPSSIVKVDGVTLRVVHAPGSVSMTVPPGAKGVRIAYGFPPDAYAADPKTDGAGFQILWIDGSGQQVLHYRYLNPANVPADRGVFTFDGALPPVKGDQGKLVVRFLPGKTDTKDWTCWSGAEFR